MAHLTSDYAKAADHLRSVPGSGTPGVGEKVEITNCDPLLPTASSVPKPRNTLTRRRLVDTLALRTGHIRE
jgi:hypothetical protein